MSILNVNQIQPVGGGQTITVTAQQTTVKDLTADSVNIKGGSANFTGNVGVQTNSTSSGALTGVGNSFVGMYIGDGFLAFNPTLDNPNGYYISASINALNAGPVTLGSTMTLDGTWVIV